MADNTKDVTLQIRARDFSQKTIDEVTKALTGMVASQDAQIASAKKGETSAKSLEQSYLKLEQAAQQLARQNALINVFNAQSAAYEDAGAKAEALRQKQSDLAKAMAGLDAPTKAQNKALADSTKQAAAAEKAQQRFLDRLTNTSARLKAYGIDTADVGSAQQRIVIAVGEANSALERQASTLENLDADLKKHRAEVQAGADADAKAASEAKKIADFQSAIGGQREKESAARSTAVDTLRQLSQQAQYTALLQQQAKAEKDLAQEQGQRQAFEQAIGAQKEREVAISRQLIDDQNHERESLRALGVQLAQTTEQYAKQAIAKNQTAKFNLGQDLKDLADPGAAALKTLDGVGSSVQILTARAAALKGPVKDAADTLRALEAAQKGAVSIGNQIDAYKQQIVTLKEARTAYTEARAGVNGLAQALQQGTASGNVVNQITGAEAKLKSAAAAMAEQTARARELRTGLEAIGVSTGNLGRVEEQLVGTVKQATAATNVYTAAVEKYGKARADGSSSLDKFNDGERTTLGFVQRLKGEVLGLAAAYVGVQGAIGLAKDTLDTVAQTAAIQSRFSIAFGGDQKKVAEALAFTRDMADRLGVSNISAAESYSKLAVSAKNAGMSAKDVRFIFEGLTRTAAQTGVSTDALSRAFIQVEQVIGKGKLGADDFRAIANDLPTLPNAIAKGLGTTEAQLREFMKAGELTSNVLLNGIKQLNADSAQGFDASVVALTQATGRLQTAKNDFEVALAKGGFEDAYIEFIKRLTVLLSGDKGKQLASQLSAALTGVVTVLQFLIEHFTALEVILGGLVFAKGVAGFFALQKAITVAITALEAMAVAQGLVTVAAVGTDAAMVAQVAAMAAAETGAVAAATGFTAASVGITATGVAARGLIAALGLLNPALALAAVGFGTYYAAKYALQATGATDAIGDFGLFDATHASIDMKGGYVPGTEKGLNAKKQAADATKANSAPGVPDVDGGVKLTDLYYAEIAKAQTAEQKKLDAANREARHRSAKEELEDRIAIAQEMTQNERTKINSTDFTGQGGAAQRAVLLANNQKALDTIRGTETINFNIEQEKKAKETAQKIEDIMRKTGEELAIINAANEQKLTSLDPAAEYQKRVDARVATTEKSFKTLTDQIAELNRLSPSKAKEVQAQVDAAHPAAIEAAKQTAANDELVRKQTQLNELTAARTAELADQKAMLESSVETYDQYVINVKAINDKYEGSIKSAIKNVREFAATVKSVQNDPAKAAGLGAKLDTAGANNNAGKQNAQVDLDAAETKVNGLLAERNAMLADIQSKKQLGLITDQQSADQQNTINALFKENIISAGKLINDYIDTLEKYTADPAVLGALEQQRQKMQQIQDTTVKNQKVWSDYESSIMQGTAQVATDGLENVITQLVKVQQGQQSIAQGASNAAKSVIIAFAQMIEKATLYIIQLRIIKALQLFGAADASSAGSSAGAAGASDLAGTSTNLAHAGGVIGSSNNMRRSVQASIFQGAQKLHTGGMPGLARDEVPTILKRNEEVLTADDPRHVQNGGKNAGSSRSSVTNQRIVLVSDERDIHAAMASAQGEEVTVQNIRKNIPTIRQMLKS